jgi:hypothetical protein
VAQHHLLLIREDYYGGIQLYNSGQRHRNGTDGGDHVLLLGSFFPNLMLTKKSGAQNTLRTFFMF